MRHWLHMRLMRRLVKPWWCIPAIGITFLFVVANLMHRNKSVELLSASGAYQALSLFGASRAYPLEDIPNVARFAAFADLQRWQVRRLPKHAELPPWRLLGPENIGGRTNAIAINPMNPSTLYAGAASGGLWRSYTGGTGVRAWHYVDTGFPVLGVNTIAIDPSDTNVIYIGTGEVYGYQRADGGRAVRTTRGSYGIGILKTSDGGRTWIKSLDWSLKQQRGVQKIVIHPLLPRRVYAATTEGVYRSDDAGGNWQRVLDVVMAMDVDVHPENTDIVYAACGNFGSPGHGIYRSRDGGETWEKLTQGLPGAFTGKPVLDISRQNPNLLFLDLANDFSSIGIYRSRDGGDSWERIASENFAQVQGWYSHYVAVSPHDSNLVLAGGIDVWRLQGATTQAQATPVKISDWRGFSFGQIPQGGPEGPPNYIHPDQHDIAFHPTDPRIIYFASDGGVFRTLDGGQTFQGVNGGYATTQFYNGFSNSRTDSILAMGGLQDNSTVIYTGAAAWTRVIGGDGGWTAIHPNNSAILYGSSQFLNLFKSTNRGSEWFSISQGIDRSERQNAGFIAPFVLSPSNPNVLYAGSRRVHKSFSGGNSWLTVSDIFDGNPILAMAVSYLGPDTVYCATAPTNNRAAVYRTFDGGQTWHNITGTLPDRYPMDLAVDPTNALRVYIVFGGFGTFHAYGSDDGGTTWRVLGFTLPDVPTSAIVVDPEHPKHLYLGNDLGVFVSRDRGRTWDFWSDGMPPAIVTDLSISPANRKLRAATHGNGAWERPLIEEELQPDSPVTEFRLHPPYPNPVYRSSLGGAPVQVRLSFELPRAAEIAISVYNVLGQRLYTLLRDNHESGRHIASVQLPRLAAGLYFIAVEAGNLRSVRKITVLP